MIVYLKSQFFSAQFQPEESTLTQGVWYANQVALIENISKSLPFGYTLVVKFHPWGRPIGPLWQYRYLKNFYNIKFSDLNSKNDNPKSSSSYNNFRDYFNGVFSF